MAQATGTGAIPKLKICLVIWAASVVRPVAAWTLAELSRTPSFSVISNYRLDRIGPFDAFFVARISLSEDVYQYRFRRSDYD